MTKPLFEVWKDAVETRERLASIAGSLKLCNHSVLKKNGYRSINFLRHRYLMLYRIEGSNVYVDAIYHQLQDYEKNFIDTFNQ